jgi:hypothetical protein
MPSDENETFEPLVIVQFSLSTPAVTKEWVIKRLTAKRHEDEGAGLLVRYEPTPENKVKFSSSLTREPSEVILRV